MKDALQRSTGGWEAPGAWYLAEDVTHNAELTAWFQQPLNRLMGMTRPVLQRTKRPSSVTPSVVLDDVGAGALDDT
jgi:hypothetical protein